MYHEQQAKAIDDEAKAVAMLRSFLRANRDTLVDNLFRWGDGNGGYILEVVRQELGIVAARQARKGAIKASISSLLRKQVFERDAYRCVKCGSWEDLTVDHIHPESLGGATEITNLQTMCRSCNCSKGARVS